MRTPTRAEGATLALAVGLSIAVLGAAPAAIGAGATISIDPPSAPVAGPVTLTGSVGAAAGEVTSVLYVYDATESTAQPIGSDCSGNGAVGAEDDLNADGSRGDILDCEIAGVLALNGSLASTAGVQAGVVAFADEAASADLDPAASRTAVFVPPGFTGGDPRLRIETVARSVTRGRIGLYEARQLGGSGAGTAFNRAVQVALATLASAPAGPKWVMFLSDGQAPIEDSVLGELASSGVKLRSFGVGAGATCARHSSLYKIAAATGETCTLVPQPARLAAGLTASQPDAVNGVSVTIKNVALAATLNAVGGWSVTFNLGAGTYKAAAKAVLASGSTVTAHRTFSVAASPGGPRPGSVAPGAGALRATVVKVTRPGPSRAELPSKIAGRVGVPRHGLSVSKKLAGAKVLLQARTAAGAPWATVGKDRVDPRGRFTLHWRPKPDLHLLRVALKPHKRFAGIAAAVPAAPISACKVKRKGRSWSVTCLTTAKDRSRVRLLRNGSVADSDRVDDGAFRLRGTGELDRYVIDVARKSGHLRLHL